MSSRTPGVRVPQVEDHCLRPVGPVIGIINVGKSKIQASVRDVRIQLALHGIGSQKVENFRTVQCYGLCGMEGNLLKTVRLQRLQ
jgi:hypothetical protein